jgi:hypothetical protein
MGWFKNLISRKADPAPKPAEPWAIPPGRKETEQAAGAEINRLVQEFLDSCRRRRRTGRLSVQNVSVTLNYTDQSKNTFASIVGKQGWVYRQFGSFVVVVSNDGDWAFAGKYQYREPQGNGYQFIIESYHANGSCIEPQRHWFEGFEQYYAERLSDVAYTDPQAIVRAVQEAITDWQKPRLPRPKGGKKQ